LTLLKVMNLKKEKKVRKSDVRKTSFITVITKHDHFLTQLLINTGTALNATLIQLKLTFKAI